MSEAKVENVPDIKDNETMWLVTEPWGKLGVHVTQGRVFVHARIYKWDHELAKQAKQIWKQFLAYFASYGVERLYSAIPTDWDEHIHTFQEWAGMKKVKEHEGINFYMIETRHGR